MPEGPTRNSEHVSSFALQHYSTHPSLKSNVRHYLQKNKHTTSCICCKRVDIQRLKVILLVDHLQSQHAKSFLCIIIMVRELHYRCYKIYVSHWIKTNVSTHTHQETVRPIGLQRMHVVNDKAQNQIPCLIKC